MANRVDENGLFVFDQDHTSEGKMDQPNIFDIIMTVLGNLPYFSRHLPCSFRAHHIL